MLVTMVLSSTLTNNNNYPFAIVKFQIIKYLGRPYKTRETSTYFKMWLAVGKALTNGTIFITNRI